jgi:hypothetical protein
LAGHGEVARLARNIVFFLVAARGQLKRWDWRKRPEHRNGSRRRCGRPHLVVIRTAREKGEPRRGALVPAGERAAAARLVREARRALGGLMTTRIEYCHRHD